MNNALSSEKSKSDEHLSQHHVHAPVTFREALWIWIQVAIYSFGGPASQIAVMHRLLVEQKQWISENRFLHALNYCMLLPGPEAQQLAIYIGWLLHKIKGGLVAGTLFVLPGFFSILILSILYAEYHNVNFVQGIFYGLKPAVVAIVIEAVIRIGTRALKNLTMLIVAVLAFVAIFFFNLPFPLIIISAGLIGYIGGKFSKDKFLVIKNISSNNNNNKNNNSTLDDYSPSSNLPTAKRTLIIMFIWLGIWFIPVIFLYFLFGPKHIFFNEAIFFSKAAVMTFGGAYAVLAYITQQAVHNYGWLKPGEMLDGLGMAETTPGPLIQVVQFVGFMGAFRNPGALSPMVAGILGSIITTWVTFVPSFLWILVGAPYIEYLRKNESLSTTLSAVTAAIVGVVLNLGIWFSLKTLFGVVNEIHFGPLRLWMPLWRTIDIGSLLITLSAFIMIFYFRLSMLGTIAICVGLGLLYHMFLF